MSLKRASALLLALLFALLAAAALAEITVDAALWPVERDGWYNTLEEVAVYLAQYDELPENYLTKREAQKLGWDASRGNLWDVADGRSIGGDRFGNYEGNVPEAKGRSWIECDIGYDGGFRGAERIVYSSDGLIYYTGDHYAHFDRVTVAEGAREEIVRARVKYGECYTSHEEVAAYLLAYGELPINYISMDEARELGFSAKKDNMGQVAPEFAIGGGAFGNREGLLPKAKGLTYKECDVDMVGGRRGDCRLVYGSDGRVYLTTDRYKSFTELKGEE